MHLKLAAVLDLDLLAAAARGRANSLDGLDNLHALHDGAEHAVLAVEPLGLHGADEELGAVGVGAGVGHGKDAGAGVLQCEVLVLELLAVDGLAAGAVTAREVTTLEHEVRDDTVEDAALVVQGLAGAASALLAGAESTEVLRG